MLKKNISLKLIKYYKLINHNLIYDNKAINRYKKENFELSRDKTKRLDLLKKTIINLKNCDLKKGAKNWGLSRRHHRFSHRSDQRKSAARSRRRHRKPRASFAEMHVARVSRVQRATSRSRPHKK